MGHGNLEHDGSGWKGGHALPYYTFIIPEGAYLKSAAALAKGALLCHDCRRLGRMKLRYLLMSVMCQNRTVPTAVVTVTPCFSYGL